MVQVLLKSLSFVEWESTHDNKAAKFLIWVSETMLAVHRVYARDLLRGNKRGF